MRYACVTYFVLDSLESYLDHFAGSNDIYNEKRRPMQMASCKHHSFESASCSSSTSPPGLEDSWTEYKGISVVMLLLVIPRH